MSSIDYRALLVKYISWVGLQEGTDFIDGLDIGKDFLFPSPDEVRFSKEEIDALRQCSAEDPRGKT